MSYNKHTTVKNKTFVTQHVLVGWEGGEEEVAILYFREESNIRNGEQRRSKRKTVMICDDERDILKMFAIELPRKYNVLTAQSGEECIKMYLDAKHSGSKIEATFGLQARRYYW